MFTVALILALPLAAAGGAAVPAGVTRCASTVAADSTPSPAALFAQGITFGEFSARTKARKAEWEQRNTWGTIPDLTAARMRAISAPLRILAVAEEGCGDSLNSIPYLVRLVAMAPSIEVRIVDSKVGRSIMEAHRTPDGRAATPTLVVLDASDQVVACWVERPAALLAWSKTPKDSLPADQKFEGRMGWYANDKGASAMAEWVTLLEGAAAGRANCPK